MDIKVEKYGQYCEQNLYEFTLVNDQGLVVKLLNYGATLEQVLMPGQAGLQNLVLSLPGRLDYSKERNFLGGTVGRVVGRIRGHIWHCGSKDVVLAMNEGKNHIHGGNDGLDQQVYNFRINKSPEKIEVIFTFMDSAGHNSYPGNLKLEVKYILNNDNQLKYQIRAKSDETTLFNPTNHTYFALDQPNNIFDTTLTIAADYFKPLDKEHLPYEGWLSVDNTVFDFRKGQKLANVINSTDKQIISEGGLNHPFLLTNGDKFAAKLETKNHRVTMTTTAPSMVVYTANHFDGTGVAKNIDKFAGIALECQYPPVSGNDLSAITLLAGEDFYLENIWNFE
ncbi:galactose mutarotase [Lactobacillus mulieris]|uniref:aldose epimerase family protein n=1 Tax=Lactobacillus mulieris TaxID=2508708 RepID=UPI0022CDC131|nr:aldose epimerase family protein [Lactobacillus mulieris]MCZ9600489.1 galactose mutarotase [Lactobacillus mulieris]